jgi:hypothetical protein
MWVLNNVSEEDTAAIFKPIHDKMEMNKIVNTSLTVKRVKTHLDVSVLDTHPRSRQLHSTRITPTIQDCDLPVVVMCHCVPLSSQTTTLQLS